MTNKTIANIDKLMLRGMRIICLLCMLVLGLILSTTVLLRIVSPLLMQIIPIFSMHWSDEIVEWSFAWMVFFGAAVLWRQKDHFNIDWLSKKITHRVAQQVYQIVCELISLAFVGILAYQSIIHVSLVEQVTPVFYLPQRLFYLCMPITSVLMSIYSLIRIGMAIYLLFKPGTAVSAGTAAGENTAEKKA